jgi:dCMP deaminase
MIQHKTFMKIAYMVAFESRAVRRKVGAVIVKDNNIVSLGYNGTPHGFDNKCEDSNNDTLASVLHAESNAISKCARSVLSSDGADMYVTTSPCVECAKLIIQASIKNVYWCEAYTNMDGIKLLIKAKVNCEIISV